MFACRFDQAPVIDFPESQAKRIRSSVALSHRVSDLQRIAHDHQCFQTRQEVFPERQRQTIAWILPPPYLSRTKAPRLGVALSYATDPAARRTNSRRSLAANPTRHRALRATHHSTRQSPDVPRSHPDCPPVVASTHLSDPDRARTRAVVASASTFLNGARRRCKSPSGFRYYFSRKGFIERRPAGCVKAIADLCHPAKCRSQNVVTATFHIDAAK